MKVAGITTAREVYIGSRDRNFRIAEYLIVEDVHGDIVGEIVDAQTFNRYLPLNVSSDFVDNRVLESLRALGYDIDEETVYIGKLRFINDALYPIETGSKVRVPKFDEVKKLLIKTGIDKGMTLGVIKNTDDLVESMDENLKGILKTFDDDGIKDQREVPYIFDYRGMHQYPHIGIFGGSGSGKSFGLRVILEEMMKKNIPTIVLDPHYEMTFGTLSEHFDKGMNPYREKSVVLQIGNDIGVNFLELSRGDLKNLLSAVSQLTDSMENVVDVLFKKKFRYDEFFSLLNELQAAQEVGDESKLKIAVEEAKDDTEKKVLQNRLEIYNEYNKLCPPASVRGVIWRLGSLKNEGVFNNDINPIENGIKYGKMVVIQGSTRIIQVFATYLLNKIYKKRREYKDASYLGISGDYFPPFFIVTDEAHNFAPKGYDSPAKSIIKEISQEGRKYGVFLVFATQRPTLLDETISAQLNTKFIFRTVRSSDIQTIKEETDLTMEETQRLPYLRTGDVFISSSALGRTSFVRIRASDTVTPHKENPFDELEAMVKTEDEEFMKLVEKYLPISENDMTDIMRDLEMQGIRYDRTEIELKLTKLSDNGLIRSEKTPFGNRWKMVD